MNSKGDDPILASDVEKEIVREKIRERRKRGVTRVVGTPVAAYTGAQGRDGASQNMYRHSTIGVFSKVFGRT